MGIMKVDSIKEGERGIRVQSGGGGGRVGICEWY